MGLKKYDGWLRVGAFSGGRFLGSFILQLAGAARAGMRFAPMLDLKHPELKKYILVTIPLMVGLTMTFSTEIFFRFFGSYLPDGSIAGLNYALRIMFIVVGLIGQGRRRCLLSFYGAPGF